LKILFQDGISHPSIENYTLSADACNKTKQMAYCIRQSTKSVIVGNVLGIVYSPCKPDMYFTN
jgi:hypothetical protein